MLRTTSFCFLLALTAALSAQVLPVGTVDGAVEDPSRALLAEVRFHLLTATSHERASGTIGSSFRFGRFSTKGPRRNNFRFSPKWLPACPAKPFLNTSRQARICCQNRLKARCW